MCNRAEREQAAYQFEIQSSRLYLSVQQRLSNYRYVVRDDLKGNEFTAMVLVDSFDYYEYRLNKGKQRVDLLVVQHHNACVPLPVICLTDSKEYQAGQAPGLTRENRQRRNHDEMVLLVSQLLLGVESAHQELARMPARTRQRYLQRRDEYLKPKRGRPIAS